MLSLKELMMVEDALSGRLEFNSGANFNFGTSIVTLF